MPIPAGFELVEEKKSSIPAGFELSEPEGIGSQINDTIAGLPRAAGIAGRYLAEGLTLPVAMVGDIGADLINRVLPEDYQQSGFTPVFQKGLDAIGLPTPETPVERTVSDVGQLLTGTGAIASIAQKAAPVVANTTKQLVAKSLAARPGLQAASAAGSGGLGGYVRETGGDELSQLLAAIVGGVAAPFGAAGANRMAAPIKAVAKKLTSVPEYKIDLLIDTAAKNSGIPVGEISASVRKTLREEMGKALKVGDISPDVVRRLVDYRLLGTTPTAGPLTRDPGIYTRQMNVARTGAASGDPKLQGLAKIEGDNARKLIENLNELGADTAEDAYKASGKVIKGLKMKDTQARAVIKSFYDKARDTAGRSAELDQKGFVERAMNLLKENLLDENADALKIMNNIKNRKEPFTVDAAEQLKTKMVKLTQGGGMHGMDAQGKLALGFIRQSLEETALLPGQQVGQPAIKAFNTARAANRRYMTIVDKTPALKAIRDGVEPDKFIQTYIIGSGKDASLKSVARLKQAIRSFPEARNAVKNNMAQWLKGKALSGAADEIGKFSQSGYNRALKSIGMEKLRLFFTKPEIQRLKAIGRVASYEQARPIGSAVNESNTGAAIASLLDSISGNMLVRTIPLGQSIIGNPAKAMSGRMQATGLQNVPTVPIAREKMRIPAVLAPYFTAIGTETKQ